MGQAFLGIGWQFPLRLDDQGQIAVARYEDSIRQAIWLILGTAPGERLMRPDFGCGIHDLVFAVHNVTTQHCLTNAVRDALLRWEPRIDVLTVQVGASSEAPATLSIRIEYRVRTTNNVFNLVYPFYLERSPG